MVIPPAVTLDGKDSRVWEDSGIWEDSGVGEDSRVGEDSGVWEDSGVGEDSKMSNNFVNKAIEKNQKQIDFFYID